jgi:hypothetical protein
VRAAFLTNMCIVSDQTSEAGNTKYCTELHARNGLRFIMRLQEGPCIVPTSNKLAVMTVNLSGHLSESCISCSG